VPPNDPHGNSADPRAYVHIADTVRHWLDEGMLNPGDKVTIADLAENYGVNRRTATKGLHILAGEGRLKRFPGFGYAVQDTGEKGLAH
jgi:DNA-binding GntR family transcriptional regulator